MQKKSKAGSAALGVTAQPLSGTLVPSVLGLHHPRPVRSACWLGTGLNTQTSHLHPVRQKDGHETKEGSFPLLTDSRKPYVVLDTCSMGRDLLHEYT